MPSPLEDIENRKAQMDMGALAYRVFCGAREDGASRLDAFTVLVAYWRGMFGQANDQEADQ